MIRLIFLCTAGAVAGAELGWAAGAAVTIGLWMIVCYLTGFYAAWRADRRKS